MRRSIALLTCLLAFSLVACESEQNTAEEPPSTAEAAMGEAVEEEASEEQAAEEAPEQAAAEEEGDPLAAPADVAAPPADAEKTESGLASKVLKEGTGTEHPTATSTVRAHYTGWTTDGEMFDSSVKRGQPLTMPLNRVIAGWTEGVQLMVEGEKRRFWIPQDLAYKGAPGAPAGMLVFDVELIEIVE
ncbi:FKBP-type peptidyl-prolyl cis-trans isomerase [Lujinxingia vulgaris]|nr:FKBP-type peptidyl-prolyl cis-trans isomerase [Lujinxingia vulgaris]